MLALDFRVSVDIELSFVAPVADARADESALPFSMSAFKTDAPMNI